jgi:DNA-binding NarL/FixJ family response regulator
MYRWCRVRKTLLLADDHSLMLEGLARLLADEYEIVGTAANGRELLSEARRLRPNVIVLDVGMPEMNGIEAARQILNVLPQTKLVFVTQQLDQNYLHAAFQAGASGYVAKQSASSELLAAIHMALQGRFYVTPLITLADDGLLRDPRKNPASFFGGQLTQRQREVLQLVAEGRTMKEISTTLNISVKTVEFHKNGLMNELGLRTTADLVRYAIDQGIVISNS